MKKKIKSATEKEKWDLSSKIFFSLYPMMFAWLGLLYYWGPKFNQ